MVLRIENITHNHMMKMIGDGDLSEAFMAEITYSTFIIPLLKDFLKDMKETLSLIRAVKSISWISMILLTFPKSLSLTTHPRIQDMIQGNCEIIEIWKE